MPPDTLLQEALTRAALQSQSPNPNIGSLSLSDSDDDLIAVRTPLSQTPTKSLSRASTPGTSRDPSPTRNTSPNKGGLLLTKPRSGAGKPRRDKTKEREKAAQAEKSMDPLAKFPGEVSGRIFGELGVDDLLVCGLVCKKWRKSATINYTWYLLLQFVTYTVPTSKPYAASSSLPTWRRGDSKEDWAARYASIFRRDDTDKGPSDEDEDGRTMKEEREDKWREENELAEEEAGDKGAMRAYYKSLGNSKVKGKSGKGMARTWEEDGLGGGGDDYI